MKTRGRVKCGKCGKNAMSRMDTQRFDVAAKPEAIIRRKTYRCVCGYLIRTCEVVETEVKRAFLRLRS